MPRHADRQPEPRTPTTGAAAAASSPDTARAWIDIDLGALARNGAHMARRAGVPLLPMIKADAYGLGMLPVARALLPLAPWGFGVATVREGEELRAAGFTQPIVVFTPVLPADFPAVRAARLTPILGLPEVVAAWIESGGGSWHLGVDTGMSRSGIAWRDIGAVAPLCARLAPDGACTHFHSAETGDESRMVQERRFADAIAALPARPRLLHVENSPAIERGARSAYDLVRPGVYLYGVGSGVEPRPDPVVHLRARIVETRALEPGDTVSYDATWRARGQRRIATVALGYADGYRRALSNRGVALLGGRRVRVAGLVTMDMTMLDVTDVPCALGDVATFLGRDGGDLLTAEDVAATAAMSPYELLTSLRARLPRRYAEGA